MSTPNRVTFEVWAQLFLCEMDCNRIREFLVSELGVKPKSVVRNMHVTVYHARRPMPDLTSLSEPASVVLAASETRFMVMAPGGENPSPELEPGKRTVGIRVHKQGRALTQMFEFRDRLLKHETPAVLGKRLPSTHKTSAFGARHFQPHMAVLRAGSGIDSDLRRIGLPFRDRIGDLTFDKFKIEVVRRNSA